MIVFFIILSILFFLSFSFLALILSSIQVEIKKLWLNSENKQKLEDYLIFIRLKLLNKITWFRIKIDNKKINSIRNSKRFNKIIEKLNNQHNRLKKEDIKYIKELKLKINKLSLYMKLCTSDSIIISYLVAIVSTIISIILGKNVEEYNKEKFEFKIIPKYNYEPSIKIKLNCIIDIKIVHIMNIIFMLLKKRSVGNDERTSNRRAYVCSNDYYSRYG